MENQDLPAVLLDQPLDEFKSEPGEPVPVGNHKSELIPPVNSLQYGEESLALPVESSPDVPNDFGVWVEAPHLGALPLPVSPLLGGADPAVTDGFWFRSPSEEGVDGRRRRHITSVLLSCGSRGFYLGQHSSGGFEGATLKWLLPCGWGGRPC